MKNGNRVNNSKVKNILGFLLVLGLVLPSFSWIKASTELSRMSSPQVAFAQTQPENLAKSEKMDLIEILEKTWQAFPGSLKKIWKEELLPILEKYYQWVKIKIWSPIKSWFNKMVNLNPKEELNSLRERFKELIK